MDWDRIIEKQLDGLKQTLAMLIAMAEVGGDGMLARPLYRAILRLLRPAETVARRLIVIAALGIRVALPPRPPARRNRKPASVYVRPGHGTGIVVPHGVAMPDARHRHVGFPLFDPPYRFGHSRPPKAAVPRIRDWAEAPPTISTPARRGSVDATRLGLRIAALGRVLGDLPKQALRFARWKARQAAGLARRHSPFRPGYATRLRRSLARRGNRDGAETLADAHYFAKLALADTS